MAEHLVLSGTVTVTHKLDPDQFSRLLEVMSSPAEDSQLPALTAQLKTANDALAAAVAANQPPTNNQGEIK